MRIILYQWCGSISSWTKKGLWDAFNRSLNIMDKQLQDFILDARHPVVSPFRSIIQVRINAQPFQNTPSWFAGPLSGSPWHPKKLMQLKRSSKIIIESYLNECEISCGPWSSPLFFSNWKSPSPWRRGSVSNTNLLSTADHQWWKNYSIQILYLKKSN